MTTMSIRWAIRYYGAYCAQGHHMLYALPITGKTPFCFALLREDELIKLGETDDSIFRYGVNGTGRPCLWIKAIPFKSIVDARLVHTVQKTRIKSYNMVKTLKDSALGDVTLGAAFERLVAKTLGGEDIGHEAGGRAVHADVRLTTGEEVEVKFHGGHFDMNRGEWDENFSGDFPTDAWLQAMSGK